MSIEEIKYVNIFIENSIRSLINKYCFPCVGIQLDQIIYMFSKYSDNKEHLKELYYATKLLVDFKQNYFYPENEITTLNISLIIMRNKF